MLGFTLGVVHSMIWELLEENVGKLEPFDIIDVNVSDAHALKHVCVCVCVCVCVLFAQSCLTLCYPLDCSLPGSSVHEILQARIVQWISIPFSKGSSQPQNQTQVFHIAGRFFTI